MYDVLDTLCVSFEYLGFEGTGTDLVAHARGARNARCGHAAATYICTSSPPGTYICTSSPLRSGSRPRFSLVWAPSGAPSRPIAPTTEHRAHHHAVDSLIIGFVKSGVVCGDACVPALACGLARESVGGFGFEVGS